MSFIFKSANLMTTWEFWTAVGITWHDGCEDPLGSWLTEEHDSLDDMNLPRVTGEISGVEFMFYRRLAASPSSWPEHTMFTLYYDEIGSAARAVKQLQAAGLFVPVADYHPDFNVGVCDPDGRRIYLSDPHPFRL
jgi:hypothetical protein